MRTNLTVRDELIRKGYVTPPPVITPAYLYTKGYWYAAAALEAELQ